MTELGATLVSRTWQTDAESSVPPRRFQTVRRRELANIDTNEILTNGTFIRFHLGFVESFELRSSLWFRGQHI